MATKTFEIEINGIS
jgi:hypothetical protein